MTRSQEGKSTAFALKEVACPLLASLPLSIGWIMMNGWWASFSHAGDNSQGIIENEDEETPIPE